MFHGYSCALRQLAQACHFRFLALLLRKGQGRVGDAIETSTLENKKSGQDFS